MAPAHSFSVHRRVACAGAQGEASGADLQDQAVTRRDLIGHQHGDVHIAAPLAQHRHLLPQCQQRMVGQRDGGVAGCEWPTGELEAGDHRIDQRARLGDLLGRQVDVHPLQRATGGPEPRRLPLARRGRVPHSRHDVGDRPRTEVVEGRDDDLIGDRSHRLQTATRSTTPPRHTECGVLLGSLGHEVHQPVHQVDGHVHVVDDRSIHERRPYWYVGHTGRSGSGTTTCKTRQVADAGDALVTLSPAEGGWRSRRAAVAASVALGVVIIVLAGWGGSGPLSAPKAIVLGAVEGITEYLPVSSTGHLLITQRLLGMGHGAGKTAADTYAIAIQFGAILAVAVLYRQRIGQLASGLVGRDDEGRALLVRLVVAFLPAAAIGVALDHTIKDHLFGPWPVIAAWAVGGAFLLWWTPRHGTESITALTVRSAAIIGMAQALALWPGVSRSLVTIVAALAVGCTMAAALEFSFLLGLATLSAATALDLTKDGHTLVTDYGWRTPILGALVAFVTAVAAVRWLVTYLRTRPLRHFGWYRLTIAAIAVVLIATGAI